MCDRSRAEGRAEILSLLEEAIGEMEIANDNSEGRTHSLVLGCGNCDAGVPMAHSLGCRARAAIAKARGTK